MDVEMIRPSSPAVALSLSAFPQANPRATTAMELPATATGTCSRTTLPSSSTAATPLVGLDLDHYLYPNRSPNSNFNSNFNPNSNVYYSNGPDCQSLPQQQHHHQHIHVGGGMRKMRKRKAETQDNERLSKRLSLLNLEQNGQKLYIPVESPQLRPTTSHSLAALPDGDTMQLDDTKHKVYIYNLDDELSDSGNESDRDDGHASSSSSNSSKLIFLPDIEKHLLQNRIPPSLLANKDGQIAGMQVVLYSEPASLSVPAERDSVRKAIVEARQRVRERQKEEREHEHEPDTSTSASASPLNTTVPSSTPIPPTFAAPSGPPNALNGFANHGGGIGTSQDDDGDDDYDPDAMEVD
ncbi:hypothetical protein AAE478_009693 [Parahypoxylon ruwenzoriense]